VKERWSSAAVKEVEEAIAYLDQRKPGLGGELAATLRESIAKIVARPDGCSLLETLPSELGYRRLILPRFPYLVIFRQPKDRVFIVAVATRAARRTIGLTVTRISEAEHASILPVMLHPRPILIKRFAALEFDAVVDVVALQADVDDVSAVGVGG